MNRISAIILVIFLLAGTAGAAYPQESEREDPPGAVVLLDVLIARPLGLVSLTLGTGVFVVALPFTLPTGSVGVAAKKLIVEPLKFTFARPIGESVE